MNLVILQKKKTQYFNWRLILDLELTSIEFFHRLMSKMLIVKRKSSPQTDSSQNINFSAKERNRIKIFCEDFVTISTFRLKIFPIQVLININETDYCP